MLQQEILENRQEENAMPSLEGTYGDAENLERRRLAIESTIEEVEDRTRQLPSDSLHYLLFAELMNRLINEYNKTITMLKIHNEFMMVLLQKQKANSLLHRLSLQYPLFREIFKMVSWIEFSNFRVSNGAYNTLIIYGSSFYNIFLKNNSDDAFGVMTSVAEITTGIMAFMILINFSAKMDNATLNTRKFRIEKFKEDLLLKDINNRLQRLYSLQRPVLDSSVTTAQQPYWCKPLEYLDTLIDFRVNRIKYAMFPFLLLMDKIICKAEDYSDTTYSYVLAVLLIIQFRAIIYPSSMIFANRLDHALQDKAERNSRWVHESEVLETVINMTQEKACAAWNNMVRLSNASCSWWNRSARASIETLAVVEGGEENDSLLDADEQPRMSV